MTQGREHAPAGAPIGFSVEINLQRETAEIIPAGELDLATIGQLQSELEALIDAGFARIVIDLRRVEFLDSTGLHALVSAHARAKHEDWQLAIIPGRRAVQRVFEITGIVEELPFSSITDRPSAPEASEPGSFPRTA
jgi:anti-anti-sigma factor